MTYSRYFCESNGIEEIIIMDPYNYEIILDPNDPSMVQVRKTKYLIREEKLNQLLK